MAISRALRRLLKVRELEEEQSRVALESSLGVLQRLQDARQLAIESGCRGMKLFITGACTGKLPDRLSGLQEASASEHRGAALNSRIEDAQSDVDLLREAFLAKRVERRQAETLIEQTEQREALEANRRSQQAVDEWYRFRLTGDSALPRDICAISATHVELSFAQPNNAAEGNLRANRNTDTPGFPDRKDKSHS